MNKRWVEFDGGLTGIGMNEAEFQVGFENLTPQAWKDTFLFASKPFLLKSSGYLLRVRNISDPSVDY